MVEDIVVNFSFQNIVINLRLQYIGAKLGRWNSFRSQDTQVNMEVNFRFLNVGVNFCLQDIGVSVSLPAKPRVTEGQVQITSRPQAAAPAKHQNYQQYSAVQCNAVQCNAVQCSAMQCIAVQCCSLQFCSVKYVELQSI